MKFSVTSDVKKAILGLFFTFNLFFILGYTFTLFFIFRSNRANKP
jgi:hypothetical protein